MEIKSLMIKNSPVINITHRGEVLEYSVSLNTRGNKDPVDFEDLNKWWSYLENNNKAKLIDEIFKIYKDAFEYLNYNVLESGPRKLSEGVVYIRDKVMQMYTYHDVKDISKMYDFGAHIEYPLNVNEDYVFNDNGTNTREQTYIKQDYKYLVSYVISLRAIVPIINHFTTCFFSGTKMGVSSKLRFLNLYELLTYTGYTNNPAFEKLKEYVMYTASDKNISIDNIYDGVTSEKRDEWLMSNIIFKIFTAPVSSNPKNSKSNLITMIYHTTGQLLDDNRFTNSRIRNKNDTKGDDLNDKLSMLEKYKIRHDISPGDIVELNVSNSNLDYITSVLVKKEINKDLLTILHTQNQELMLKELNHNSISLLSWCVREVCPPKGLSYLQKDVIIKLITAVQYYLFDLGFPVPALLIGGYANQENFEKEYLFYSTSPESVTNKFRPEVLEKLKEMFPYAKPPKRNRMTIKENEIIVAGDLTFIAAELYNKTYYSPFNQELQNALNIKGYINGSEILVDEDIRNNLAELIIAIN